MRKWFMVVRWCDEDIICALADKGIEPTPKTVRKVRMALENNNYATDTMIEAGWETIYQTIRETIGGDDK